MRASTVTVLYEDGRTEDYRLKPRLLIDAERHLGGVTAANQVEATFFAAWKASGSELKFDAWLDTVDNLDQQHDEGADPTPPAPSPDESPA